METLDITRCDRFRYTLDKDQFTFQFADLADPQAGFQNASASDSGDDTDDEIKRIQARQQQQVPGKEGANDDDDDYGGSTDVDSEEEGTNTRLTPPPLSGVKSRTNLLDLPSFFAKYHFLLYGDFDAAERKQLTRYITAFDG